MTTRRPADIEHDHLTWAEAEITLMHTDTPEERKPLFHALALCPVCADNLKPLLELRREGQILITTSFGEIECAIEERAAPALWERLEAEVLAGAEDRAEVLRRLKEDDRWPTWGLAVWHALRSLEAARRDPAEALRWGELAVAGAEALPPDRPAPEEWNAELRAFARAVLGNALRVAGDLEAAEAAFRCAHEQLQRFEANGSTANYLPYRPRVYDLESSFFRGRRMFPKALERLDDALEAWEVVENVRPEDRARVLLNKAHLFNELQQVDVALKLHEEAAELLAAGTDDGFRLAVVSNWLFYLARLGRTDEAAEHLPDLRDLADAVGNELDRLRVDWVAAHVHEAAGAPQRSEALYREVLDGFCVRRIGYDAALVAMDLARLLLHEGRTDEVKELALSVKPIFEALGVEAEVRRAVRTYLAAREREALEVSLLTRVWWERREGR